MRNRPIGLGIQGLADTLVRMKINFDSDNAVNFNTTMMETIYHAALTASSDMAKDRFEMAQLLNSVDELPEYYDSEYFVKGTTVIDNIPIEKDNLENQYYHKLRLTRREQLLESHYGAYSSYIGSHPFSGCRGTDIFDRTVRDRRMGFQRYCKGKLRIRGRSKIRRADNRHLRSDLAFPDRKL